MRLLIYQHLKKIKYGNIINISSTNTSFTNVSVSHLFLNTNSQYSGILCQSVIITNVFHFFLHTGVSSYNPSTLNGDMFLVYELLMIHQNMDKI